MSLGFPLEEKRELKFPENKAWILCNKAVRGSEDDRPLQEVVHLCVSSVEVFALLLWFPFYNRIK